MVFVFTVLTHGARPRTTTRPTPLTTPRDNATHDATTTTDVSRKLRVLLPASAFCYIFKM